MGATVPNRRRENPDSRLGGERRPRHDRIWEQRRSPLGPDAVVAGSRCGRGTSQIRQKAWGLDWGGMGRRERDADLNGGVFKIGILKVSGSALAAEFCTGPHNRLLRRQHCSSLCSQSEGHEHVANIASALGHIFVGFLAVFGRHNIRPPHFASKVSYSASPQTFAECSRSASCRCTASALLLGQKSCRVFSGF